MRRFDWLSKTKLPPRYDLRLKGWQLGKRADCSPGGPADCLLAEWNSIDSGRPEVASFASSPALRARVLVLGIDEPSERAALLRSGYGDVLGSQSELAEIEARAQKVAQAATALPRMRELGPLRLDLFARDGFVAGRPLGLHPREFELIWRLADTPGIAVGKAELVDEVWRMTHVPDTNSVAVHIFRLRAKLGSAGLNGVIQTAPSGGYLLALPDPMPLAAA